MSDPTSFRGTVGTGGRRQRLVPVLAAVVALTLVGVAIVKPWGSPGGPPSTSPGPAGAVASPASATSSPSPGAPAPSPRESGEVPAPIVAATGAFDLPVPPPATARWTGLRWRRLDAGDPLALVRSVVRWRGGSIALGRENRGGEITTPIWTSRDGAAWRPLPGDTATTFWPGTIVIGVAEVPAGLVAVTVLRAGTSCGAIGCRGAASSVIPWTSADGLSWKPGATIDLPVDAGGRPLLAAGPSGLLVISSGTVPGAATSTDGVRWNTLAKGAFPKGFVVGDLRGTAAGYVVVGGLSSSDERGAPAPAWLWSADGRTWVATKVVPAAVGLPPVTAAGAARLAGPSRSSIFGELPLSGARGIVLASTGFSVGVESLVAGRDGLLALGEPAAAPGATRWLQSPDGRSWRALDGYPPLGPIGCPGDGCGQPDGLVAGDGERMVALRGGTEPAAWTSSDGLRWQPLEVAGDAPGGPAPGSSGMAVAILPWGVLVSDDAGTWLGEALVR